MYLARERLAAGPDGEVTSTVNRLAAVTLALGVIGGCAQLDGKEISSAATGLPGSLSLKQSFVVRQLDNGATYPQTPYVLTLSEGNYEQGQYRIDGGLLLYKGHGGSGVSLNQIALVYWGDDFDFRIGKFVSKTGVLDYLSGMDLLNPVQVDFFDDPNINLRRLPQWMAELSCFVGESALLRVTLQPFDGRTQSYISTYVGYLLDSYLPDYFEQLSRNSAEGTAIYREVFLPLYRDGISPALKSDIDAQYNERGLAVEKSTIQVLAESSDAGTTLGAVWTNRYSEVPYIEVDQQLLDLIGALPDGQNSGESFRAYLDQPDLNPIKGVRGFRYNQYSLYAEGTVNTYGVRAEASVRDRVPTLNTFSPLAMVGFGVDRQAGSSYFDLEVQWGYLKQYRQSVLATVLLNKFDLTVYRGVAVRFDHYLITGWYAGNATAVMLPNLVFTRGAFEVDLHALYHSDDKAYNTVGFTLRATF
ncbi:hypothetical protein LOH54_04530 [Sulfurimonas sp. HSL-3221]|uniref:hypothetical protein n=1 Tax=Sulfurimonadaceae TaxID=2771471 RepID=UPI001E613B67|nr:hypothetical protein [Sulfurimonas sp. HSL-3221]UFS63399.1 hypothetical protein LOH54_04530 [Sulfurimonas sp. HSL-3221]